MGIFNKEEYWASKKDNIGSKRQKPLVVRSSGKLRAIGSKLANMTRKEYRMKYPDERNTKTHRDNRTAAFAKERDAEIKKAKEIKGKKK